MSTMQLHSIASRALFAIAAATLLAGVFAVKASEPDPKVLAYTLPDKIQWTGTGGARQAVVAGDPTKPGLYIVLTKWLPHNMSRPHFHPNDRYIYVISGTWWVGTGSKYDPDSTKPIPAGSFVTHYGGQIHYDGAKDGEAVLEIVGMGPATSTPAEAK
jgi:quercetin dioxygenase-like cupin family protein